MMEGKQRLIQLLLLLQWYFCLHSNLVQAAATLHSKQEIFISKDGTDSSDCGSIYNKCKSFIAASKNILTDYNYTTVITIDSGNAEQWLYQINQTFTLPSNVLIRKNPLSPTKPVIGRKPSSQKLFHAFQTVTESISNVTIDSVDFKELFIIRCERVPECYINISNTTSSILESPYIKEEGMIAAFPSTSLSIVIDGSKFQSSAMALYINPSGESPIANISIQSTHIEGSAVQLESYYYINPAIFLLRLNNVTFTSFVQSPIHIYGILDSMVIANSIFKQNTMKNSLHLISVNKNAEKLQNRHGTQLILFQNTTFVNNEYGDLLNLRNVSIVNIANIIFTSNKCNQIFNLQDTTSVTLTDLTASGNVITEDAVTIYNSRKAQFFNIDVTNAGFNKAIINVTNVVIFSLNNFKLENTNIDYDHCIHIENSSVSISDLSIRRNQIQRLFNGIGNRDITIEHVYVDNSRLSSFWFSKSFTFTLVFQNMTFIGVRGYDRYSALISHHPSENIVAYQSSYFSSIDLYDCSIAHGFHIAGKNIRMADINFRNNHFTFALFFKGVKNNTIARTLFVNNTAAELIRFDHNSEHVGFHDFKIVNNNVSINILYCQQTEHFEITNFTVIGNTIKVNVFMLFLSKARMRDIQIYNNTYRTGISISNCYVDISELKMARNNATGSTRDFYYGEFYFLISHHSISKKMRCLKFKDYVLTLSNTVINTTIDLPMKEHHHSVTFFLTVPRVVMKNVTINLEGYQTAAFEIYTNERKSTSFQPDLLINCPVGASPRLSNDKTKYMAFKYEVICQPCRRDTYSVERGKVHLKNFTKIQRNVLNHAVEIIDNIQVLNNETINVKCLTCSVGGDCQHGKSSSRGNFYGYIHGLFITYVPCPLGYCCSNRGNAVCKHFKTCMIGREGTLCGSCHPNLQENFYDSTCVSKRRCEKQLEFWFIFLLYIFIVFLLVCFFDVFLDFLFWLPSYKKKTSGKTPIKKHVVKKSLSNSTTISTITTATSVVEEMNMEKLSANFAEGTCCNHESDKNNQRNADSRSISSTQNILVSTKCKEETYGEELRDNSTITENVDSPNISINSHNNKSDNNKAFDIKEIFLGPAIFQTFISFYQLRSLIIVKGLYENQFTERLTDLFNVGMLFQLDSSYCPYSDLGPVDKTVIKLVFPPITMLSLLFVIRALLLAFSKRKQTSSANFEHQLEVCYSKILLFNYKNIAYFCFLAFNCVLVQNNSVLFINGNIKCFQTWQYIVLVFFIVWVFPFPFALCISFDLYKKHSITYRESMVCLTFPIATVWYYHRSYIQASYGKCCTAHYDDRQLLLVKKIHLEPYRIVNESKEHYIFWEHWRLIQRLIMAAISAFVINPLYKVTAMVPCIVAFALIYTCIKPFKQKYWVLHWLEVTSILCYFVTVTYSYLKAFIFVYSISDSRSIEKLIMIFSWVEIVFSPAIVFLFLLIVTFIYKVFGKLKKD